MTKDNLRDYDDAFKLRVLSDYYQSGMSKSFISRMGCKSPDVQTLHGYISHCMSIRSKKM